MEALTIPPMNRASQRTVPVPVITLLGLATLAAAMGIGRFAFTPLLPLMQQHDGITLAQGAWLATANYVGYLVGALATFSAMPSASSSMRAGLIAVAASTAAMAVGQSIWAWMLLRFVAGVASAFVLVGVSAWALGALATAGRYDLSGWVFSGVGLGIVFAGLVTLVTASSGMPPAVAWLALGGSAFLVVLAGWGPWTESALPLANAAPNRDLRLGLSEWVLIVCYGGFGFGYIIPATFIPAIARSLIDNALVFGWAWPFFGVAGAVSTVLVVRHFRSAAPRTVAVWGMVVMAIGVIMPALAPSMTSIAASALCVGGTFMVVTMAGFQEARRISSGPPARLIAAMTAAFALGQLSGPTLVGMGSAARDAVLAPSVLATLVLLVCAATLALGPGRVPKQAT